jgi:hypothetical protein
MSSVIYNSIPLVLSDSKNSHEYLLRYNSTTDSFRLEGRGLKRSIFIGRNAFNRLFQFFRNEYGCRLGNIQYENRFFQKGKATTSDNKKYLFIVDDSGDLRVELQEEFKPQNKITAVLSVPVKSKKDRGLVNVLIPSILTAIMYAVPDKYLVA